MDFCVTNSSEARLVGRCLGPIEPGHLVLNAICLIGKAERIGPTRVE